MTATFFLSRACPIDTWRIVTERLEHGELIELPGVEWFSQAVAERDKRNGKQRDGIQEALPLCLIAQALSKIFCILLIVRRYITSVAKTANKITSKGR